MNIDTVTVPLNRGVDKIDCDFSNNVNRRSGVWPISPTEYSEIRVSPT